MKSLLECNVNFHIGSCIYTKAINSHTRNSHRVTKQHTGSISVLDSCVKHILKFNESLCIGLGCGACQHFRTSKS